MQAMMTREAAERRLAELAEEERAKKAAATAEDPTEKERRELLTVLERSKEAERETRLAAARAAFVATHKATVTKLLELAPELLAWEQAKRSAMGSGGMPGAEVGAVREVAASVGRLLRERRAAERPAPTAAEQREAMLARVKVEAVHAEERRKAAERGGW